MPAQEKRHSAVLLAVQFVTLVTPVFNLNVVLELSFGGGFVSTEDSTLRCVRLGAPKKDRTPT